MIAYFVSIPLMKVEKTRLQRLMAMVYWYVFFSFAHTHCVGLGRVASKGNWYYEVYRPIAFESPSFQMYIISNQQMVGG